jgi:UDP-glucose 4-epimerase
MKILVTGASGFIGENVASYLSSLGDEVIGSTRSEAAQRPSRPYELFVGSMESRAFEGLVRQFQPECVVHCAGSASVGASMKNPLVDHHNNVALTRSLYSVLAHHSPNSRVIFMSSAAVYGQPTLLPISEQTRCAPISPYGQHKLQCEELGEEFHIRRGLRVMNLRVFSAYGNGLTKQVLWDIFQKSRMGQFVVLAGDGTETRDFIHVEDIARIVSCLCAIENWHFRTLNVASGESVTVRQLANRFLTILDYQGQLRFNGQLTAGSPRHWKAHVPTMTRLGLSQPISLEQGLHGYVGWLNSLKGVSDSNRVLARAG